MQDVDSGTVGSRVCWEGPGYGGSWEARAAYETPANPRTPNTGLVPSPRWPPPAGTPAWGSRCVRPFPPTSCATRLRHENGHRARRFLGPSRVLKQFARLHRLKHRCSCHTKTEIHSATSDLETSEEQSSFRDELFIFLEPILQTRGKTHWAFPLKWGCFS